MKIKHKEMQIWKNLELLKEKIKKVYLVWNSKSGTNKNMKIQKISAYMKPNRKTCKVE